MNNTKIKTVMNIIALLVSGVLSVVFTVLFFNISTNAFISKYKTLIIITAAVIIAGLTIASVIFVIKNKPVVYKSLMLILGTIAVVMVAVYFLTVTGILDKIRSIDELRKYVASFGGLAAVIYIIMNILQVVVLPIPGFVAVAVGVALFGPFKATLYAFIGIMVGSVIAYFIGKYLGYNVVKWLVGQETLDKWLNAVKNKDRIILTFMFVFPMFPDDVLCFVAGMSSMSTRYFLIMLTVSRILSIVTTAYSVNGSLIPYTTWWGLLIWAVIIVITVCVMILLYKKGDKVERKILEWFRGRKSNAKNKNDSSR